MATRDVVRDHVPAVIGRGFGEELVADGARAAGGKGDAIVRLNNEEHARRQRADVGAITDLYLLDQLMTLPLGHEIRIDDIANGRSLLTRQPPGVIDMSTRGIRRLAVPPLDVRLVIVRSSRWWDGLRRAAAFEPFAQRVLLLPSAPRNLSTVLWEADLLGVGVWTGTVEEPEQYLAPAPWHRQYIKAAGWRFAERAYAAWLKAMNRRAQSDAASGRRVRPTAAGAHQQTFPLLAEAPGDP